MMKLSAHNMVGGKKGKRITGCTVGRLAKRRPSTEVANAVKQHLYTALHGCAATRWGHLHKPGARQKYLQHSSQHSPGVQVNSLGLVVSRSHPWLAACPDELVLDPMDETLEGVVEYKNLYNARNMTIPEAVEKVKDFRLSRQDDGTSSLAHMIMVHIYRNNTHEMWCSKQAISA